MLTVFLVVGVGQGVKWMLPAPAGEDIGSQIATGLAIGIVSPVIPATLVLLFGGVYYVTARKDSVTFREAIFNWPLVILAGIVAFLSFLS